MRNVKTIVATLGVAGATAMSGVAFAAPATAATAGPAAHRASCVLNWGTNAKHRGDNSITVATRVRAVRAGKHGCFDRLVIDMSGGKRPPFRAQYVKRIVADPSGKVLTVRGKAKILITVRGPAGSHYHPNAVNLADVSGFKTFRQVRGAGSFERVTSIGLGVRAKLPLRVFELGSSESGWRIVIDVAHSAPPVP
ncbi:MAG: hypothetical protein LBV34_28020 [Nocardiopsaceae bacterium]|jgi:hypothetical protein|nr:hypothetical protein [Nocardiopsaceae bacterium]